MKEPKFNILGLIQLPCSLWSYFSNKDSVQYCQYTIYHKLFHNNLGFQVYFQLHKAKLGWGRQIKTSHRV